MGISLLAGANNRSCAFGFAPLQNQQNGYFSHPKLQVLSSECCRDKSQAQRNEVYTVHGDDLIIQQVP